MAAISFKLGGVNISVSSKGVRAGIKVGDTYISQRVVKVTPPKRTVK